MSVAKRKLSRSRFLRQFLVGLGGTLVLAACNAGGNGGGTGGETGATATTGTATTGATPAATGTITVATEPAFPPFESQVAGGSDLEGFDIDLLRAIGEASGLTVNFQSLPFDGIIPALQAGTVDAAVSAITITEERAKTVSFSRPYFKAGLAIAVRADDTAITSFDSLQGKKIAAQIGTTGATEAGKISGAQVRTFDSAPLALQELANGNVDAVINDAPVTLYAIKSGNLKNLKVVGELLTEEFYGIALPKNSQNLEAINTGLGKVIEDGTYAEIYRKWFDADPPQLPETVPAPTPAAT
ncbi:basic amino acid ABC transporter substrate-binding protein [Leptolyngbya sp. FACHB-261]|uniref:basic amino acid ABC transporter substrate-binding protein n=1 Tax=Leptolyngbya sp. FACHB-261 TaxID=2692806 RepID=UPI001689A65E|nr:transporter substrate-binding domain-containing protein [Leptolyngbya sp. FACHB-261]MBD2100649.1 basic amino acid ABC transporter substrate-binding protein [Leptolyngbya sp. FACHB-261]